MARHVMTFKYDCIINHKLNDDKAIMSEHIDRLIQIQIKFQYSATD